MRDLVQADEWGQRLETAAPERSFEDRRGHPSQARRRQPSRGEEDDARGDGTRICGAGATAQQAHVRPESRSRLLRELGFVKVINTNRREGSNELGATTTCSQCGPAALLDSRAGSGPSVGLLLRPPSEPPSISAVTASSRARRARLSSSTVSKFACCSPARPSPCCSPMPVSAGVALGGLAQASATGDREGAPAI